MAIRLRMIDDQWIALCAARSVESPGDIYLDDGMHSALGEKFARDFNEMFDCGLPSNENTAALVEVAESDNPNRTDWDRWIVATS